MKRASVSEAKNRLSALLDKVRQGETVVIEDRGVPVARLEAAVTTPDQPGDARLARLERAGVARRPTAPPPLKALKRRTKPRPGPTASELLIAERRESR